jgi:GDP-L-fucose synthase
MNKERILVTGGTGLVGKSLKSIMPNANYVSSSDMNLLDYNETLNFLKDFRPTTIVHSAAKVGGIIENLNYPVDFIEDNVIINSNIIKASYICDVKNFIGVLSTCIYPDLAENYPLTEDDLHNGAPPAQNFAYAYAKRCLGVHIDSYRQQYNKENWCYVIPCNLYGEHDKFDYKRSHYVSSLIDKIYSTKDGKFELLGTGAPLRQFMYAGDLARAIKCMISKDIFENVNVATDEVLTIKQIADIALDVLDKNHYKYNFTGMKVQDGQFRKDVSSEKLKNLLGGFEYTKLSDGIKKVYESYKGQ